MAWTNIAETGLSFTFTPNETEGALSMSDGVVIAASAGNDVSGALFDLAISGDAPVRLTFVSYETQDMDNGASWNPALFYLDGAMFARNEAAPYPDTTWTIPTGPQSAWVPNPIEFPDYLSDALIRYYPINQGEFYRTETFQILVEVDVEVPEPVTTSYNCTCDDTTNAKTLGELRASLMSRLGFGAQAANPPPGMTDLLNSFLIEAQELLYRRYDVLRTERLFSWPLVAGVRLYDLPDNAEVCTKKLDPRKVTWVGAVRDEVWYPLVCGIPPELYSHSDRTGYPQRYEIRQCIEVWPAPEETSGSLVIKGHFGLEAFAADADKVTIDDRAVFLLALSNAKAHYRQPDAQNYVQQLEVFIDNMVAGAHHTRRYVPGTNRRADMIYVAPKPLVPFPPN